jgi:uncharacterized protein YrrD
MSQQPTVIKQSDLLNQVVLDRASMREVGHIEVLWTYPKAHRVFGFICQSGWLGSRKTAFNLDQLEAIGSDGIITNSPPVETDAEKVRQLESLVNYEVWTDAGDRVGKISDYTFDLQSGEIQHYLYVSSGWGGIGGSIYMLPPNYILRLGNRRAVVPEGAVESFAIYRAGIQEQFSKAKDLLREEKTQVSEEMRSLVQQAREKARSLTEQAREKARLVADQVREQTSQFVDDFDLDDFDEPVTASNSSDPDPWDDWEVEERKPEERQSSTQESRQSEPKRSSRPADAWDDDDDDNWI